MWLGEQNWTVRDCGERATCSVDVCFFFCCCCCCFYVVKAAMRCWQRAAREHFFYGKKKNAQHGSFRLHLFKVASEKLSADSKTKVDGTVLTQTKKKDWKSQYEHTIKRQKKNTKGAYHVAQCELPAALPVATHVHLEQMREKKKRGEALFAFRTKKKSPSSYTCNTSTPSYDDNNNNEKSSKKKMRFSMVASRVWCKRKNGKKETCSVSLASLFRRSTPAFSMLWKWKCRQKLNTLMYMVWVFSFLWRGEFVYEAIQRGTTLTSRLKNNNNNNNNGGFVHA